MLYQIFDWISRKIDSFRGVILILIGIAILYSMWIIPNLTIDNNITSWYTEGDPALKEYKSFLGTFGNDEVIITCITDTIPYYDEENIKSTIATVNDLTSIQRVSNVLAYTNIPYRYVGKDYQSLTDIYLDKANVPAASNVKRWMTLSFSRERLIGKSDSTIIIYIWPDTLQAFGIDSSGLYDKIDSVIYFNKGQNIHLSKGGVGVIYRAINDLTQSNGMLYLFFSYIILIAITIVFLRSYSVTIITFIVIFFTNILLLGFMAAFNKPVNTVNLAIPPLIMVIGVANMMHFVFYSREKAVNIKNNSAILLALLSVVSIPVMFNMVTTAGGFLSLMSSSVHITRDFGLLATISVLLVSLLTWFAVVIFRRRLLKIDFCFVFIDKIGQRVGSVMLWSFKNPYKVFMCFLFITLISIYGLTKVKIDTDPLEFIPKNHKVRIDHDNLVKQIDNYVPLEFVVKFKKGIWRQKQNLALLDKIQTDIEKDTNVSATVSVVDFVKEAYKNTPGHRLYGTNNIMQMSQSKLTQITGRMQNENAINSMAVKNGNRVRITANIPFTSANHFKKIYTGIEDGLQDYCDKAEISVSGYIPLYSAIVSTVTKDQVKSILLALSIIILIMFIVLRSGRFVLVSIPSNIFPILLILGLMGFFKINLDLVTVTLSATILGIVVDDTLHILFGYKKYLSENISPEEASKKIGLISGNAVVSTSIILVLGYTILAFSSIPILSVTGFLMIIAFTSALFADICLIPAFMSLFSWASKKIVSGF